MRLQAHVNSTVRKFRSTNVVGMLPGTSAGVPSQAVVYSAHYDHLGIDAAMRGDNIYNGAVGDEFEAVRLRGGPMP